jgi:hypothetical protein
MDELYTFLSIIIVPALASIFLYLYKSKCSNVKLCWGACDITRDVREEEKLDINNRTTNNIELSASV